MSNQIRCALATNVSKPESQGTGRSKVTSYLITTSFDGGESLVRRTFEDFEWVQRRLVQERMGIIVPVLPTRKPANQKEAFSDQFISDRQEGLDRFLQRVIHHPELVDSPSLLPFFTAGPTDWTVVQATDPSETIGTDSTSDRDQNGKDQNTIEIDVHAALHSAGEQKKRGKLGKWFAAKRDQWALQNKNLILEETPAEGKKFNDLSAYAEHLETCVRILSEDYKQMVVASNIYVEKYQSMGAAYAQLWGENELSTTNSSVLYQSVGRLWSTLSKLGQDNISFGSRHFDSPMEDLLMDVLALKAALAMRKAALYSYTKKFQEGRVLNGQMEKLRQNNDFVSQQDKYYQLERDLRVCDASMEEGKKQCKLVTSRLERDIERFRIEWHERMRQVLETFHKQQIEYLQIQSVEYAGILPTLSALESGRAVLPTGPAVVKKDEIKIDFNTLGAKAFIATTNGNDSEESNRGKTDPVENMAHPPPPEAPPEAPPDDDPDESHDFLQRVSMDSSGFDSIGLSASEEDGLQTMNGESTSDGRPNGEPVVRGV